MAPEVAQRMPYTEKVDVYSFGIMVWQMARDRVPFKGLNKEEFFRNVVRGGERPKLDKSWPSGFSDLLISCWDKDPRNRPSFAVIAMQLNQLIGQAGSINTFHPIYVYLTSCLGGSVGWSKRGRAIQLNRSDSADGSHSSWF
jgi:serine/threonine protein kinase